MKLGIYLFFAIIAVFITSCTNPSLKGADEDNSGTASNEPAWRTYAEDISEKELDLDLIGGGPIELPDSTEVENDKTIAVDDYIWRELSIAEEYYNMGMIANRESAWEEAQYYFEKSLNLLGDLDIVADIDTTEQEGDPNSNLSPEAAQYNELLADIIAGYRSTLLSLGHLPSEISADVLIARFSDINHLEIDSTELGRLNTIAEEKISYNVPIVMNERVKKAILYYQTVARDAVERYLSRSTKYIPMIDSIFISMGVPTDIKYLALVESGYNPNAYSWARAMGLWQFIASTGRMYNMHRNWWYDERKDPVKATIAAGEFLTDLYEKFGSWDLAMAAYNGGPGRVSRQIKRQKTKDFWKLDLRKQTEDYVPFYMAATMISKDPEKFGFTDIKYVDEWEFDLVKIDRCLDLKTIAKSIGCKVKEISDLNPELLRRFTPPNKKNYSLRIPKGKKNKFLAAYDAMPSSQETSFVRHKIRKGETVSTIAGKYGVSQYAIFEANNLSRRSKIYAGKNLIVPVPNDKTYNSPKKNNNYKSDGNVYVVRSGDTVWDIARAFGKSTSKIRRWNKLDRKGRIYVGQKLIVGESNKNSMASKSNDAVKSKSSTKKSGNTKDGIYVVKRGDTLWEIAQKFGMTTSQIKNMNNMRSSRIYPKQSLKVKVGSAGSGKYTVYTMKRGDTISDIAKLYNVSARKLMAWNGVSNPKSLPVGYKLKIYNN